MLMEPTPRPLTEEEIRKGYLPGDVPYPKAHDEFWPRRQQDNRYVFIGTAMGSGYSKEEIFYDTEADRFVEDLYHIGSVDPETFYDGMKVISREEVLQITYRPTEQFAEILGRMPEKYLKPKKGTVSAPLSWPPLRTAMMNYCIRAGGDDFYWEMYDEAEQEIRAAAESIPKVCYFLGMEDSEDMIDQLIAFVGEMAVSDLEFWKEGTRYRVSLKLDRIETFPNVIFVCVTGLLAGLIADDREFELSITFDKKQEDLDGEALTVITTLAAEFKNMKKYGYRFFDPEEPDPEKAYSGERTWER